MSGTNLFKMGGIAPRFSQYLGNQSVPGGPFAAFLSSQVNWIPIIPIGSIAADAARALEGPLIFNVHAVREFKCVIRHGVSGIELCQTQCRQMPSDSNGGANPVPLQLPVHRSKWSVGCLTGFARIRHIGMPRFKIGSDPHAI